MRIDGHVHLIGNGRGGSGCRLRLNPMRRLAGKVLERIIGLGRVALESPDFDRRYADHLLQLVRSSSLDAVVLLAHEEAYQANGRKVENFSSFYVPNGYVLGLAKQNPEFLPAVAIHPARPDAMDELARCVEGGAVMLKLIPCSQNVDCNDPRYRPFWQRVADANLPFLAHTGGENTVPVYDSALADPRVLRQPLECGVTVIAAHCATSARLIDRDYFPVWRDMLDQHPNLCGDTSALLSLNRPAHLPELLAPDLLPRVVHGSDYPVPVLPQRLWLTGAISREVFRQWGRHPNPLERDYQIKRAMGFPDTYFAAITRLLRDPATGRAGLDTMRVAEPDSVRTAAPRT